MGKRLVRGMFLACAVVASASSARAELVLSAPPNMTDRARFEQLYTELAKGLSRWLGETVRFEAPLSYEAYAQAMREGRYDLVVDNPHFASWRATHLHHELIAQASNKLAFLVISKDPSIQSLDELHSKRICSQPSPNLGTLLVLAQFPNPMRQPIMKFREGYEAVTQGLRKGECEAALISAAYYENKLAPEDKATWKIIYNTRQYPGLVLTAGPKIKRERIENLRKRLIEPSSEDKEVVLALNRASLRAENPETVTWKEVKLEQIKIFDELLASLSWGW